ncbi:hypothetical protein ABB30_00910 [Stenotrophomonas ginsengisoli]|uniref:DUF4166 domain-containing protein n=1 Tax=Stenotrophomonas ginsengisoli TaxID=336566 RepID=A0A0R0DAI1_9GAMM|nr:DUF4166 domain-containing protein [Stenotrophomonas ginsengisoli]KRG79373.1 hypothetical protein ABB30_00910 [Stenotrophomonas ginsengisoli]
MTQPSVFAQLLGTQFAHLSPRVAQLHQLDGPGHWQGQCVIQRGQHPVARLCAWAARLPPGGQALATTVTLQRSAGQETWTRNFGGVPMRSRMWPWQGRLRERLGLVQFDFQLGVQDGALTWNTRAVRVLGIVPLPAAWFAGVQCTEAVDGQGRYTFDVRASLPLVGLIVHYRGWLLPG